MFGELKGCASGQKQGCPAVRQAGRCCLCAPWATGVFRLLRAFTTCKGAHAADARSLAQPGACSVWREGGGAEDTLLQEGCHARIQRAARGWIYQVGRREPFLLAHAIQIENMAPYMAAISVERTD